VKSEKIKVKEYLTFHVSHFTFDIAQDVIHTPG